MSCSHCSEDKSTITQVIREVYEGDESCETFENELEKALEAKVKYIIIEPQLLGDETALWIRVGNCLHKTAVVSGLASIVCAAIMPDRPVFSAPLNAISIFCTGLYTISWNVDYCCQYQVRKFFIQIEMNIIIDIFTLIYLSLSHTHTQTGRNRSEKIRKNTRLQQILITRSTSLYEKYSHKIPTSIRNTVSNRILCMDTLRGVQIESSPNTRKFKYRFQIKILSCS